MDGELLIGAEMAAASPRPNQHGWQVTNLGNGSTAQPVGNSAGWRMSFASDSGLNIFWTPVVRIFFVA